MKQLSLEGFELDIEINPENKKDITDCAVFFEGEGQRIIDLNRTSEFLASMEKGKYTVYKTGGTHLLPMYKDRTDFPFVVNNSLKIILAPTFSRSVYPSYSFNTYKTNKRIYCHRIFAMAFISCPNVSVAYNVDHINEDKLDYSVHNLQWVSVGQNMSNVLNKASNKGKKYKVMSSENYM